jgi:hypothetical protein
MLITPHALLGAALVKKIDSFFWGIPLAITSHFALDAIPSWDVGLTSVKNIAIIITDGIMAFLLLSLLSVSRRGARREKILLWTGGFFGVFPDVLSQGSNILGIQGWNLFENFHQSIQKTEPLSWSLPVQVLLTVILVGWIYYMTKYTSSIGVIKTKYVSTK